MNLDEQLSNASEALSRSTESVVATDVERPGRARVAVVGTAVGLVALGGAAIGLGAGDRGAGESNVAAVAPAADVQMADEPIETADEAPEADESAEAVEVVATGPTVAYVSDSVPDGYEFDRLQISAELGEPDTVGRSHVYGLTDRMPTAGDVRLSVFSWIGEGSPPMFGEPIDVRGGEGRLRLDRAVVFQEGSVTVVVVADGLTTDEIVAVADGVVVDDDGARVLSDAPGGLVLLRDSAFGLHPGGGSSVPFGGASVDYMAPGNVGLSIFTEPAGDNAAEALAWGSDAGLTDVAGRQVSLGDESGFLEARWVEGDHVVSVLGQGLTVADLETIIEGLRPANADEAGPVEAAASVAPADGPIAVTSDLPVGTARVAASVLPDDLSIAASGDHATAGTPSFMATMQQFVSADGSASVLVNSGPATPGHFPGELVDVDGVEVNIIDKAASGSFSDVEFTIGDTGYTLGGRNLDRDQILAVAASIIAAGNADVEVVGDGLELVGTETYGVWQRGTAVLTGPADGASILYNTGDMLGRQLYIVTSPLPDHRGAWYEYRYDVETVEVGGVEAEFGAPQSGWLFVRIVHGDQMIELRANEMTRDELLAAAGSLRPALDTEWDVGS